MNKQDIGMLEHFLPAIMTILLLGVLWFGSLVVAGSMERSTAIDQVARKYMLTMETKGYLSAEDRDFLLAELAALGIEDIDLSGSSFTDVGYGQEVHLVIRGNVRIQMFSLKGLDAPLVTERKIPLEKSKVSIAKN